MEPEGVPVRGLVEEATVDTKPECDVSGYFRGDELCLASKGGISLWVLEPEEEMLSGILLNVFQVLNLSLMNQVPDNCIIEIQVP